MIAPERRAGKPLPRGKWAAARHSEPAGAAFLSGAITVLLIES
jgi:hypothetical protein